MKNCPKGFEELPKMPDKGLHPCSGCDVTFLIETPLNCHPQYVRHYANGTAVLTCPVAEKIGFDWTR